MTMFIEENRRREEENKKRDDVLLQLLEKVSLQSSILRQGEELITEMISKTQTFSHDPECGGTFTKWIERFEDAVATHGSRLSEEDRARVLVMKLDTEVYNLFRDHIRPRTTKELKYEEVKTILETLFGDKDSIFRRRYDAFRVVLEDMNFRSYATMVNRMCELAQVDLLTKEQIKCLLFVSGMKKQAHSDFRTLLLQKLELQTSCTLEDLCNECEHILSLRKDANAIGEVPSVVQAVQRNSRRKKPRPEFPSKEFGRPSAAKRCFICDETTHLAMSCPKKKMRAKKIDDNQKKGNRKFAEIDFGGIKIEMQLDSGADVTIINTDTWEKIGTPGLDKSSVSLSAANGTPIEVLGCFEVQFRCQGFTGHGRCFVAKSVDQLLGIEWLDQLPPFAKAFNAICCQVEQKSVEVGSLSKELSDKYPEVFKEELGRCSMKKAEFRIKEGSCPIFCRPRKIPFTVEKAVDTELDRLVQAGVLKKVDYSHWAAPIVIVHKKNGTVRICADFKTGLNEALETHRHPLPTPEEIFSHLNQGAWFTQIDLADAYLQMEVNEDSKELVTVNTHRGLYQYQRLPFGVKCAPGIFQEAMDGMLVGLQGCAAYLDDIIVTGTTLEEHNRNVHALFKRIAECGFRVRMEKCSFAKKEIKFLGNLISKEGRRPDPEKIHAIVEMPPPKDKKQLKSFLGMISFYSSFVPEMRSMRGLLDDLEKKDKFSWTAEHQVAFNKLKTVLQSDLLVTHFRPEVDIVVAADACEYGLGAVISHRFPNGTEKAIAHAGRTLTKAEQNYGQIEKEALALVFAVRKFHRYLYGRRFTLLTDHKPLLSIFGSKTGVSAHSANRLQRWELSLLSYDFRIEYRKTNHFGQADALSQLIASKLPEPEDVIIAKIEKDIQALRSDVIRHLPVTQTDIRKMTESDELQIIVQAVQSGRWPDFRTGSLMHAFHSRARDLSVHEGILFLGMRAVIPLALRHRILKMLHEGHPGCTRMKLLARRYVYWQGIDRDIEEQVKNCSACQDAAKMPARNEPSPWPTPNCAWERIHVDFAGPLEGLMFLIVVDAFSKWPEVVHMSSTTATGTIKELTRIFAQQGFPKVLVSDNGTQFTSREFQSYCQHHGIQHIRSPPYHPQSNGQAERFVDTFKRTFQKLRGEGATSDVIQKFLWTYRSTPCLSSPGQKTPAENCIGRQLRTPISDLQLQSHLHQEAMEGKAQQKRKVHRREFAEGDTVYLRLYEDPRGQWAPGVVIRRLGTVLYNVRSSNKIVRRHANQLRPRSVDDTLNVMLETFNLPLLPLSKPHMEPGSSNPVVTDSVTRDEEDVLAGPEQTPRQKTKRRPPRRLELDTSRKKYSFC